MIWNYILIAFRSFRQQKSYTFLNVMGLALGMAASILIFQYVKYERSFDQFHSRASDIYRIQYNGWQNGQLNFESAVAVPAVGPALKNNFPEVEAYTRLLRTGGVVRYERPGETAVEFREDRAFFADTSLFRVFDFELVHGNDQTCLKGVSNVVISQSMAKKYFGDDDALGKRLSVNDRDGVHRLLEVTGVFADVPESSHIKFDFLVSFETLNVWSENASETSWDWLGFYTFVLLKPDADPESLQAKWNSYLTRTRTEEWKLTNSKQDFILQPLKDIHLYSNLRNETSPKELRDGDSVYALSLIAAIILIIAWVNYVNLATARSFKRANEVGVRKVVGALKSQLIGQFLMESFIMNITAAVLALLLVRILWHPFIELTGWNIPLSFMFQQEFWVLVAGLFIAGAFVSGFYPAIVLSSFKPVSVLKGKLIKSSAGNYLRKGLVVFQFAASVFLISGSLIVYDQLIFMKNKDLGMNISETMVLKGPLGIDSLYDAKYESFKTEVLRIPGVKGITASYIIPGEENWWIKDVQRLQGGSRGLHTAATTIIDEDHIPQYEMRVMAGRNFSKAFNEEGNALINEALLKELQFETPAEALGQKIVNNEDTVEIVGVVADFHQMSLKKGISPYVFRYAGTARFYSIKLEGEANYKDVIAKLAGPWETFFPGNPVDYFFLDQFFDKQYERDDRFGKVFTVFTILAIVLAAMGLLGLASFMTLQRTREIGIRKIMGSSVSGVILLLTKEFIQPVLIAIAIALPLVWWLMNEWLQTFAYHVAVRPLIFFISGMLVMVVAFISVSSQTLKAALAKPVDSLKHD
ncbi:ABC transporter permease [Fulvivirgaceae bacterium PWU4]|uniref:ABC transporter permease n=1 Tax=Chryseosolibacter histidini TaxID=2782349 RepID=A0AAP2GM19_9BACT|nr:ABC transporter permease [Chryseosolibacter histidini]MBT1701031.1 ABC transporter permease [Chryseosolibacter histidini]